MYWLMLRVHDIDIVQFLVDQPLVKTEVFTNHIHCDDRADYGHLMMRFDPNLMVNIHVSWALPFKEKLRSLAIKALPSLIAFHSH